MEDSNAMMGAMESGNNMTYENNVGVSPGASSAPVPDRCVVLAAV